MHKWFNGDPDRQIVLTTDKEGRVTLGKLKKVMAINVSASFLGLHHVWFIGNQSGEGGSGNLLTYPHEVDVVESENLEFPIANMSKKTRKNLSLIKLWTPDGKQSGQQVVLEDLFDKLEFIRGDSHEVPKDYSIVRIANLQEGTYKLMLKKVKKTILITVHRGQYWDTDSFILKRNCLFENRAPLKMIKISNV